MADSAEVVGGELVAVHDRGTVRLSLAVPLEGLDVWLELDSNLEWRKQYDEIRDRVMPASAREQILALEVIDAVLAVALLRRWVVALNERLGKSLSLSPFGEESEPPLLPTSGSDTDSTPTESEQPPSAPPKPRRRTPKPS